MKFSDIFLKQSFTLQGDVCDKMIEMLLRMIPTMLQNDECWIFLSSTGGSTVIAKNIIAMLKSVQQETRINIVNTGRVDSSAVDIYMSIPNRYSLPGSSFTIHGPSVLSNSPDKYHNIKHINWLLEDHKEALKFLPWSKELKLTKKQWKQVNEGEDLELYYKDAVKANIISKELRY